MSSRVVYYNGRFVPEREARVSIYDSALCWGDMAYEVTRTVGQRPFRLREHLARLGLSLQALQIEPGLSLDELVQVTHETLAKNLPSEDADVDWNIIHNVSRGPSLAFRDAFAADELRPTVLVSCYPLLKKLAELAPLYESGVDLIVPPQRSLPSALVDDSIKTRSRLHYQLANLQVAKARRGAWAALVDPDGYLTEGTSGNLFLVRAGELLTPEARNLLPGITRHLVMELAERAGLAAREANLAPDEARQADEMFVTATSIGIIHARSFNGAALGDGRIGPITAQLREALSQDMGVDFVAQANDYARRLASR